MNNRVNRETENANALIQALDNTGVLMFMYYPQIRRVVVPERTRAFYQCREVYDNMPESFAEDIVYEDDYPVFNEMYHKINNGEKLASAVFHNKDLNYCAKVTLTTVGWMKDGKPEEVIGLIEDRSDLYNNEKLISRLKEGLAAYSVNDETDEALKTMAESIGSQYFAVYYIWLKSRTYLCFQERLEGILSLIGKKGSYEQAWEIYIKDYIEEEYHAGIREFIDINTLAERIGSKNSITYIYKRKEVGWARGQFIAGKRDENGRPLTVIYTVSDINEEMETKRKKKDAELEALQDPMTKLWNRKAFEQFKEDKDFRDNQSGLLLLDIDRFKEINDQYGHNEGDKVIITVAQEVRNILRQKDVVFRVGGDEFAVLLYNCDESVWNAICRKIELIHTEIKNILPTEMNVTISAGLCVSKTGYYDEMIKLTDQAMYNTKVNGRGGCTFVDPEGKIIKEWHDKSGYLRKGDVLEKNSTVTWRMEIPKNKDLPPRIYGDEVYMDFLGFDNESSPEEVYAAALSRMDAEYLEIVDEALKSTIREGQSEAIYLWNHPEKGKMQLRCSSSLDFETDEYYSLVGYIHMLKEGHVFTLEDVNLKIQRAMEEMFFCSFYIRLSDYSYKVYKAQPYMEELLANCQNAIDATDSYIRYMVADESKEEMKAFLDLTTIKERMKEDGILGNNYNDPNIGWSRAVFTVVDRDENGEVETVSLVVEAIV